MTKPASPHAFPCTCGNYTFDPGHCTGSWGPWYCGKCGIAVRGKLVGDTHEHEFDANRRKITTWDLLRLNLKTGTPVHICVDGFQITRDGTFDPLRNSYWYDEHTCPWNYLRFFIVEGDNPDPHGIFFLVDSVPVDSLLAIAVEHGYTEDPQDLESVKHFLAQRIELLQAVFPKLTTEDA